jgi:hypothetical protein
VRVGIGGFPFIYTFVYTFPLPNVYKKLLQFATQDQVFLPYLIHQQGAGKKQGSKKMATKCIICKAPHPQGITLDLEDGEFFVCSTACYYKSEKLGLQKD